MIEWLSQHQDTLATIAAVILAAGMQRQQIVDLHMRLVRIERYVDSLVMRNINKE